MPKNDATEPRYVDIFSPSFLPFTVVRWMLIEAGSEWRKYEWVTPPWSPVTNKTANGLSARKHLNESFTKTLITASLKRPTTSRRDCLRNKNKRLHSEYLLNCNWLINDRLVCGKKISQSHQNSDGVRCLQRDMHMSYSPAKIIGSLWYVELSSSKFSFGRVP